MKQQQKFKRRQMRIRTNIAKNSDRLRLSVYRSGLHISAQIIDDKTGLTLVSASSQEKGFAAKGSAIAGATLVGETLGKRAMEKKISEVVFDRGGYMYHGRIKALADAARAAGLSF